MGADIRRKGKVEKVIEFVERMRKVQKEAGVALKKVQEEMKRQADRERQEVEEQKKEEKLMLSTRDSIFKKRLVKKLIERYVGPYKIEVVVLRNAVKLKLPASIRVHLVVNVSRIVRYKESVRRQRVEKPKPVKVEGVKEWKVEKILNKRKIQGIKKYLVHQKGFTTENDTWEKKEDLENARKLVNEFEERISTEVR